MSAAWVEGRYGYSTLTAGLLVLTVGWATSGGGYEWSASVGARGTKKYKTCDAAKAAAVAWARRAVAEMAAGLSEVTP